MPELLTLAACEKVLIDEQRNPTLVVLMERIEAQIPEGQSVPANVLAPKEWVVFTLWKRQEGEKPGHCRQFIEVVPPGNLPIIKVDIEFDFNDRLHKVTNRFLGIPVGTPGTCWINVRLESAAGVTGTFSYPLEILHKSVPIASLPEGLASKVTP